MSLYALGPGYVSKAQEKAQKRTAKMSNRRMVYAVVDKRDGFRCRACRKHCQPGQRHHHHLRYRSQGGNDTTDNVILVCAECHERIHRHTLTVGLTNANDIRFLDWEG